MTSARLKRLGKLEQAKREQLEGLTSRAMDRLTSEQLGALEAFMRIHETPEHEAAVSRLTAWGNTVPEVRDAPELGEAAAAWRKQLEQSGGYLPRASSETAEQLRQYAEQWRELSERPDCPEQDTARAVWGIWAWWEALARESRGEQDPF